VERKSPRQTPLSVPPFSVISGGHCALQSGIVHKLTAQPYISGSVQEMPHADSLSGVRSEYPILDFPTPPIGHRVFSQSNLHGLRLGIPSKAVGLLTICFIADLRTS